MKITLMGRKLNVIRVSILCIALIFASCATTGTMGEVSLDNTAIALWDFSLLGNERPTFYVFLELGNEDYGTFYEVIYDNEGYPVRIMETEYNYYPESDEWEETPYDDIEYVWENGVPVEITSFNPYLITWEGSDLVSLQSPDGNWKTRFYQDDKGRVERSVSISLEDGVEYKYYEEFLYEDNRLIQASYNGENDDPSYINFLYDDAGDILIALEDEYYVTIYFYQDVPTDAAGRLDYILAAFEVVR
jgi:hypothetical protein